MYWEVLNPTHGHYMRCRQGECKPQQMSESYLGRAKVQRVMELQLFFQTSIDREQATSWMISLANI
jgi:hypothetical protein